MFNQHEYGSKTTKADVHLLRTIIEDKHKKIHSQAIFK